MQLHQFATNLDGAFVQTVWMVAMRLVQYVCMQCKRRFFPFFLPSFFSFLHCYGIDDSIAITSRSKWRWKLHTLCDDNDDNHNSRACLICISIRFCIVLLVAAAAVVLLFAWRHRQRMNLFVRLWSIWLCGLLYSFVRRVPAQCMPNKDFIFAATAEKKYSQTRKRHVLHWTNIETPSRQPSVIQTIIVVYSDIKSRCRTE